MDPASTDGDISVKCVISFISITAEISLITCKKLFRMGGCARLLVFKDHDWMCTFLCGVDLHVTFTSSLPFIF